MQLVNSSGQPLFVFDRSRVEDAQTCPRLYYWRDAFLGLGIVRSRQLPIWNLLTGTYIHEGIELVLKGEEPHKAADTATAGYKADVDPILATLDLGDRRELILREFSQQLDLVQALVYGWALVGLPRYNSTYELVSIENEESISFLVNGCELRLMTRADITSRLKGSGQLMIHNLKSVSEPNDKWRLGWTLDMQTLTERIATEDRVGEEVLGVVIEGLVKGSRSEYPKKSGFYQHGNPLIWAWADRVDGQKLPGETRGFYGRYEWTCTEPHVMGNGHKCGGGKEHRLGKGVYKARVEEEYPGGIFGWIDWLAANDRQLLEQQFVSLPPIGRSSFEVERWKRQVLPAELKRQQDASLVDIEFLAGNKQRAYELLDYMFPMKSGHGNCLNQFGSQCTYYDICWAAADPTNEDEWVPRVPNHPLESELIQLELTK